MKFTRCPSRQSRAMHCCFTLPGDIPPAFGDILRRHAGSLLSHFPGQFRQLPLIGQVLEPQLDIVPHNRSGGCQAQGTKQQSSFSHNRFIPL
jgi:hypothetical protein